MAPERGFFHWLTHGGHGWFDRPQFSLMRSYRLSWKPEVLCIGGKFWPLGVAFCNLASQPGDDRPRHGVFISRDTHETWPKPWGPPGDSVKSPKKTRCRGAFRPPARHVDLRWQPDWAFPWLGNNATLKDDSVMLVGSFVDLWYFSDDVGLSSREKAHDLGL